MKKRLLSLLIISSMIVSLSGCGAEEEKKPEAASGSAVSEAAVEVTSEPTEEPAEDDDNLIEDGTFDGDKPWDVYTFSGGSGSTSIEDGELHVSISDTGDVEHGVQVYYDGFSMNEGTEYEWSFDARSTVDRTVSGRIQINGGDYHAYFVTPVELTSEMKSYSFSFKMEESSDPAPRMCFNMGMQDDNKQFKDHDIYFDNIRLVVKDDSGAVASAADEDVSGIRLNQIGYKPGDEMNAVFADVAIDSKSYKIVDAKTGKEVVELQMPDGTHSVTNANADETDMAVDFSFVSQMPKKGTFKIVAEDGTESPEFKIGKNVYDDLLKKTVKMLYLQRCGTAIDKKHGGKYSHKKCHSKKATLYWDEDVKLDVSGGWHDAGDYGRYVVSGAKAAADLLLAYESYKDKKIIDNVGVPNSGDGVDDLLQEAKYELDWMLKMQSENGLVYSKVTCANFPGTVMPEKETEPLIISYTSTPATADFVAVMSLAARLFKGTKNASLKAAAGKYLKAAKKSWKYLAKNKKVKGHTNPEGISTGEYPDTKDRDERLWAAAELYRTTGDKALIAFVDDCAAEMNLSGYGWLDCGGYGCYAALMNKKLKKAAPDTYKKIYDGFFKIVDEAAKTVNSDDNPYGVNRTDTYEWGSNMGIANDGMMFLMASRISDSMAYDNEAHSQLDYLLGKNPTGYCFVTGFGTKSPKSPHHRPSQYKKKAVPGMLVGGVNNGLDDPYCQNVLKDTPAAKCYVDVDQSYSTNEVAVYWNSPLIYLLAAS